MVRCRLCILGRKKQKRDIISFLVHHIMLYITSVFPFAGNVSFAYLVKVLSARFLNWKVTYFPYFMCCVSGWVFFNAILMVFLI